jgi:hypothetical protein
VPGNAEAANEPFVSLKRVKWLRASTRREPIRGRRRTWAAHSVLVLIGQSAVAFFIDQQKQQLRDSSGGRKHTHTLSFVHVASSIPAITNCDLRFDLASARETALRSFQAMCGSPSC